MLAKYTIELYKLFEDENFKLFDFTYNLYDNTKKEEFEDFFKNYFFFNEIGFETVGKFKKALQNKLNVIYYKYKEYYRTCLEVEKRNFMNTKEIKEEFERIVDATTENATNTTSAATQKTQNIFSKTPKGSISSLEKYMTEGEIQEVENEGEGISTNNGISKQIEKTSFISEGNLGVNSDGFLIDKWREIIIDINEKICNEELSELFMQVF